MAITAPVQLITAVGTQAGTTITSASFTPAANTTLIVFGGGSRNGGVAASKPTISDSVGLTWTERGTVHTSDAVAPDMVMVAWSAPIGGSPVAMTVTVTCTTTTSTLLGGVYTFLSSQINTAATWNFSGGEDLSAGDPPFNLGTVATGSAVIGAALCVVSNPITHPTGYTEYNDVQIATARRWNTWANWTGPAASGITVSTGTRSITLAIEVPEPSAGPSPVTGTVAQTTGRAAQDASGTVTAPAAVTGTVDQTVTRAAQDASGTNTAPVAITGTIAQTGPAARHLLSGSVLAVSAFQADAFQSEDDAFQVEEPAPVGHVGFIVNIAGKALQAASGTVTAVAAVTGTVVQATSRVQQAAAGTVIPAVTGTVAQTTGKAAQALSGTVTAPAAVTGTVVQTAPTAAQAVMGSVAVAGAIVGQIAQTAAKTTQSVAGTVTAPAAVGRSFGVIIG